MTSHVDLWDVQGNIVRAYGRFGYPHACHLFFAFASAEAGKLALALLRPFVTNGVTWHPNETDPDRKAPDATLNLGLTWRGMQALVLPQQILAQMPAAFADGMARRASILSDTGASAPETWDPVWRAGLADPSRAVHLWVALNGKADPATGAPCARFEHLVSYAKGLAQSVPGLTLLSGHGEQGETEQRGGLRLVPGPQGQPMVVPKEHFGFVDGISDPSFAGQTDLPVDASVVAGRGRYSHRDGWQDLATGEFILGTVDESQEIAGVSRPAELLRNGSFAVFRKLEQDVAGFEAYIARNAEAYAEARGIGLDEAAVTLKAKLVGRWPNGAPLMTHPTYADMQRFDRDWADIPGIMARGLPRSPEDRERLRSFRFALNDFTYRSDRKGMSCPMGAHIRRGNPRDMLDPLIAGPERSGTGTALTNRRRILRRGIPYGPFDGAPDQKRGLLFIAICADLERQFEFVQQQWMNHGMDMGTGNTGCPLIGRREPEAADAPAFVIPAPEDSDLAPHFLPAMPDFVHTRGGDYFFLPSMTFLLTLTLNGFDPT